LVIKALDPDWIRIRIGIQPKMLDPDPDEMNADPQPCFTLTKQLSLSHGSEESTFSTKTEKGSKSTLRRRLYLAIIIIITIKQL
jgi:hypothetical protein